MRTLFLVACLGMSATALALDEHSYARYDQVRVKALDLDLDVSFERKALEGHADLELEWIDRNARTLELDTRDLTIERVLASDRRGAWKPAKFALAEVDKVLGARLTIQTPKQPKRVRIHYRTAPQASGLQWLTPAQTLGKERPFMFSQSQAIHARSWVPLQDTPAVRFTYTAHIGAPAGLRAVMSADNDPAADGKGGYRFTMPQPIPSYLLAIAVGELQFAPLGTRAGVYAEPGRLVAAAKEFEDTEAMIAATEKLYGPYRWGRYDILVLPPSFPYGGMENPRLTFATPTVIAGDKSLVALIAHELAHSWSGNLVTNAAWKHMWLNEGFTVYVENRIVEAVFGTEQALMAQVIDETELLEEMKKLEPGLQWLVPELKGRDPDETYSIVPYTKGAWLLRTIEQRVGRPGFDRFLRSWFDSHAFQSVATEDFLAFLNAHLLVHHPEAMTRTELDTWLVQPGVPRNAVPVTSPRLAAIDAVRAQWLAGALEAKQLGAKTWVTQEWLHFLNGLPKDLKQEKLAELDAVWHPTATGNSEIATRWFVAGIRAGYAPIRAPMEQYLISIGRRKLVVPLYEELAKTSEGKAWALAVYAKAKPGYHPVTQSAVELKLGI